jgi:hypothetical protein
MADSMTVLRKAGPPGTKRNIAGLPASVLPEAIEERGGRTPSL